MDKLIAQINEMSSIDAINTLKDAIEDVVEFGYTSAIVILNSKGVGDDPDEIFVASSDSGIGYPELITSLQVILLRVINDYNTILESGEDG